MLRKSVSALILVPLAIALAAFAVANRRPVVVSFDPFDAAHPAFTLAVPLFALMLLLVGVGVIIGGIAAWLRQSRWRRAARLAQGEARELRAQADRLRQQLGEPATEPRPPRHSPRLTIAPPAA
jgi:uncharacterized integral membrane protein